MEMNALLKLTEEEKKFENLLDIWVEWMGKNDGRGRMPTRAAIFGQALSNYSTAEDDAHAADEKVRLQPAIEFDACVESLYAHERQAVYKANGLRREYTFSWVSFEQALSEGMERLRGLVARRC